ncbi:MAG: hypothetical protein ACFE0O_15760 [Opitutales bacterium]
MNRRRFRLGLLLAAGLLHAVGLLEAGLHSEANAPAIRPVAPLRVSQFKGTVFVLKRGEVRRRLVEILGHEPEIHLADEAYVIIEQDWVVELWRWLRWTRAVLDLPENDPQVTAHDLNNLLIAAAGLAERDPRMQVPGAVILGEMRVELTRPWGTIPAGGERDFILYFSDAGFFVVDVLTGQAAPLRDFPNRAGVRTVLL